MSLPIFLRALRDCWPVIVFPVLGVVVFEALFVALLAEAPVELLNAWLEWKWVRRFLQAALGAELPTNVGPTELLSLGYVHPLLLTLTTRATAAEMERGTADLLLGLPVSRSAVYGSASLVWVLAGVPMALAPLVGQMCGVRIFAPTADVRFAAHALLVPNLLALYLAVGGISSLLSTLTIRRGYAIANMIGVLLFSGILNALEPLWSGVKAVAFLGLMNYYKPLPTLQANALPLADMAVLLGIGAAGWVAGLVVFSRRDIPAA